MRFILEKSAQFEKIGKKGRRQIEKFFGREYNIEPNIESIRNTIIKKMQTDEELIYLPDTIKVKIDSLPCNLTINELPLCMEYRIDTNYGGPQFTIGKIKALE